jgi:DNA-binding transcriptional MerR regulator
MAAGTTKSPTAFLTISELAGELGLPQHILRYWESRFPQLKPLQRAGNRRYYRADDANLARKINHLLNVEGYTVKGVQKLLSGGKPEGDPAPVAASTAPVTAAPQATEGAFGATLIPALLPGLKAIRDRLSKALTEDDIAARV